MATPKLVTAAAIVAAALGGAAPATAKTKVVFKDVRITEPAAVAGKVITRMKTKRLSRRCRRARTVKLYYPTFSGSLLGQGATDRNGRWSTRFSPPPDVRVERLGVRVLRKEVRVAGRTRVCKTVKGHVHHVARAGTRIGRTAATTIDRPPGD